MPDPTREQFEAAAKTVMQTAPAGLSREQFFDLIDKEMTRQDMSDASVGTMRDFATGAVARRSGGIVPTRKQVDEQGNEVGADGKPIPDNVLTGFFRNTVRNPMLEGAAHPTGLGDVMSLLLPSTMMGMGDLSVGGMARSARSAVKAGMKATSNPALHPIDFVRAAVQDIKAPGRMATGYSRYMPNRSPNSFYTDADALYRNPEINLEEAAPVIDRYMPNVSSAEAPAMAIAHDRIPYGAPPERPSAGYLRQRAPSVSLSDAEYDQLLKKFGGQAKEHAFLPGDSSPSMDATDWHSGAEPGSAEAASANKLHQATGEMGAAFKAKMDDPLASLLVAALLGGGSAKALMSSHGATP